MRPLLGAIALSVALAASALADEKTTAVVIDRNGSIGHGDPDGDGRVALAFALALAARPGTRVLVFAPGQDQPVEGDALSLDGLRGALDVVLTPPAPGGCDLRPLLHDAAAKGEKVLLYTSGELDVVDAKGRAPDDVLAKAREGGARPDRQAVNEAARALLAGEKGALDGKLVALVTPLPEAARSVPFLEALGARTVPFVEPLEATRGLAKALAGLELPAPGTLALEGGHGTIPVTRGARIVLIAPKAVKLGTRHALALGRDERAWIVDADAPLEVEGEAGSSLVYLVGPRANLDVAMSAHRLATGLIAVSVAPEDRTLLLAARADDQDLERGPDGVLRGRLPATEARSVKVAIGSPGALGEPREVPIERALLVVAALEAPLAGAKTRLAAKAAGVPRDLLPESVVLSLAAGDKRAGAPLARKGESYEGEVVLAEGTWTLESARAGELTATLEQPLVAKPAGALTATLVLASAIREGGATVEVDVELSPPLAAPATLTATAKHGQARVEGTLKDRARLTVALEGVAPGDDELELVLPLARGAEARARVSFALVAAPSFKKPIAVGLIALGLLWVFVVATRRRALERRFGQKQLRGIGSNGKMSYERYLLADHRDGRWAAVAPPGQHATAVRIEIGRDGRVRARALEGSQLHGQDTKAAQELLLVHETSFVVRRGLYGRPWVYLEREPTADELGKRYVEGAPSYDGGESRDSDVFVLLDDHENMVPASQRLVPIESSRLPQVDDVVQAESDEAVVVTDSTEERVLDDEKAILDPGSDDSTLGDLESSDHVEN